MEGIYWYRTWTPALTPDLKMQPESSIFEDTTQRQSLVATGETKQGLLLTYPDAYLDSIIQDVSVRKEKVVRPMMEQEHCGVLV